jgi:hypothetical protein
MKRKAVIASHVQCMYIHITFTVTWSTSLLFVSMWCWTPLSYLCSFVIFWSAHGKSSVNSLNICDNETIFILNFVYFLRYISYTWPLGGERSSWLFTVASVKPSYDKPLRSPLFHAVVCLECICKTSVQRAIIAVSI